MGHVVSIVNGTIEYEGMLSSREKASIDEIIEALQSEIPSVESELKQQYGDSCQYKYYLGKVLGLLLQKFGIPYKERRKFWDEIKYLASEEKRARDEGTNSVRRSFYEQCYVLSQFEKETVDKLSWRQWENLLDRKDVGEDDRLFSWIKNYKGKIKENEWREFHKALHQYLKKKDTSVFSDAEIFEIYDSIMVACKVWLKKLAAFSKEHPKSQKIANKTEWSRKYYAECFQEKKARKQGALAEKLCAEVFEKLMLSDFKTH